MVRFIPCHETITAKQTAALFQQHVFSKFGVPQQLITDRGPQFSSKMFCMLLNTLGIQPSMSMAYHPQMDGQIKRVHQQLEQALCAFINYKQDNWVSLLSFIEFSINGQRHSATGHSPFFLMYGYEPSYGLDSNPESVAPAADERLTQMKKDRG